MADDEVNPLGSPTTNYGWIKPTVGGDNDAWGGMLNTDLDGIDTTVKSVSTVANAAYPASNPSGYQTAAQVAAAIPAPYVLPTASTTVLGGVKVDGTTVAISGGGVISAAGAVAVSDTAPSSPLQGSLWFDTNGAQMYVWYNDGTSQQWVPVVNQGYAASSAPLIVQPPAAASWTQRNFGGSTTLTNVGNGVALFDASVATVGQNMRGMTLSAPTAPYTIDVRLSCLMFPVASGFFVAALGWTDGTKIQAITANWTGTTTNAASYWQTAWWTNYTTLSSGNTTLCGLCNFADLWLRISDNGTNITTSISADGVTYFQNYTIAKASGFLGASGYTNVGVFLDGGTLGNGGSGNVTLKSWYVH